MKKYLAVMLCCFALNTHAQNVQEVIKAERSFAAYARDYNTRDAFLKFMDSAGLVFNNGVPVNAIKDWSARRANTAKLLWEPAFAGISASGDIGFTSGPWQYKKAMQDSALATGVFTSIWRKNANGEWKNIVDLGYAVAAKTYQTPQIKVSKTTKTSKIKNSVDVLALDQKFIDSYNTWGKSVYNNVLIVDSWLNMNNLPPFTTPQQQADAIVAIPAGLVMKPIGGGISNAKDLAYVYGSVAYQTDKENYLRVWQQTDAGWKIILQVLLW